MVPAGIAIGLGATVLMDVWAWLVAMLPGQPPVSWGAVGRWVWHLRTGRVAHATIGDAAPFAYEEALGWLFHYLVGIAYGVIFVVLVGAQWLRDPTFLPAWLFGLVTVGAGWFLLQPALGLGWAAARLPNRQAVRALNLIGHTVFALGLFGTALLLR